MDKNTKLIKDCKVGDTLYYVYDPDFHIELNIFPVKIEEIKYGNEFEGGDTYKCVHHTIHNEYYYEFKNENSDFHDSLIVDMDYAYDDKNHGRFYTSYQGAVDYLIHNLQFNILKEIGRLERIEEKFGISDYNLFIKKTKKIRENYIDYKKIEIYDNISNYEEENIDILNEKLKNTKVKVYKQLIETDAYGNVRWSGTELFIKEFDSIEEANIWIKENDKSYYHGNSEWGWEGDRYFIKEDE